MAKGVAELVKRSTRACWFGTVGDEGDRPADGSIAPSGGPTESAKTITIGDVRRLAWGQMIVGLALIGIGVVGTMLGRGGGNLHTAYIGPIVAGVILAWRGFTRW